ncbi:MAG: hypothetical protein ACU843_14225 [Gammaproteobacteria bacterium]
MRNESTAISTRSTLTSGFFIILYWGLVTGMSVPSEARAFDNIFRLSNLSNEFQLTTPEGVNARGSGEVRSNANGHHVKINVNGLTPGAAFVVINHWFDPIPTRGIGTSDPAEDPSCNGHFQFLGTTPAEPAIADHKGRLNIITRVSQLAPHIWVVDLAKFLEVTGNGSLAPSSPDAFVIGGLLIPFGDLVAEEGSFVDAAPLTQCM